MNVPSTGLSRFLFVTFLLFNFIHSNHAQYLVGYWQNWNDANAPYISLDQIDNRYNVVNLSFPLTQVGTDYDLYFTPCCGETQAGLISKIQTLQANGVIVNMSIGGATVPISLDNATELNTFVSSVNNLINTYGLDGLDIDLEGSSLSVSANTTIANPTDTHIVNMIAAIQQIMADYQSTNGTKMFLSTAPETAFVQGGQSNWGGIWGAYLPLIDALRNDFDLIHVQLYNSGSMYGIDGNIYAQGTADFIVSQTEAVLQGFNVDQWSNQAGTFNGFDASKVAVGLPACPSAAGGGFTSVATVKSAIEYLMGTGNQPGSYQLQGGPYPTLKGMMTWSINWDATASCNSTSYEYAANFEDIFLSGTCVQPSLGSDLSACSISFPYTLNSGTSTNTNVTFTWTNISTGQTIVANDPNATTINITEAGIYQVKRDSSGCSKTDQITVSNDLPTPSLPAAEDICAVVPLSLSVSNAASFPGNTVWQWYENGTILSGENSSTLSNIRTAATYKITTQSGSCNSESELAVSSSLPTPFDGCAQAGNPVLLEINASSGGPYSWYESASGGGTLATGLTYTTPALNTTTTYYVEDEGSVGEATTGPDTNGSGLGNLANWLQSSELTFDANTTFTLKEITVFPLIWCNTHTFSFEIRNSSNVVLTNGAQSFSITDDGDCSSISGAVTLTLSNGGVEIPQGSGYKIVQTGSIGFNHWQGPVTYPLDFSPYFSITGGNFSNYYMAVHNWKVEGGSCSRLPVIATIDPGCSAVLASELSLFEANYKIGKVEIKWQTEQEIDLRGFEIQRKTRISDFEKIGWISSKNEIENHYLLYDRNIEPNHTYYYRLKEIEQSGDFSFSPLRVVQTPNILDSYKIYPNPANGFVTIQKTEDNQGSLNETFQLYNSQGVIVLEQRLNSQTQHISLEQIPKGLYFIHIHSSHGLFSEKLFVE